MAVSVLKHHTQSKRNNALSHDSGLSIVEIVVSVMLLGLLAIAFLPFLLTSLKISVSNVAKVTATEIVSQNIELLRNNAASCADLEARAATMNNVTHETNQGHTLTLTNTVSCTAPTADVTFTVIQDSETVLETSSTILIGTGL